MDTNENHIFEPDYSAGFSCIADKCRHSCCIGWEIDIDEETLRKYRDVPGDFGKKLLANIAVSDGKSTGPSAHFILAENERCPFLDEKNLCELIRNLGEGSLCEICTEHPRFYNYFGDRLEKGYGLCCEEAARLLFTHKEPIRLFPSSDDTKLEEDPLFLLREKIFSFLSERTHSLQTCIDNICRIRGIPCERPDIPHWGAFFEELERLDPAWNVEIEKLKEASLSESELSSFRAYMEKEGRGSEYRNLLWYLIYRHFSNAFDEDEACLYVLFSILGTLLVEYLGACRYKENGSFTMEDQIDIARMFSSEIEYSDENIDLILEEISARDNRL